LHGGGLGGYLFYSGKIIISANPIGQGEFSMKTPYLILLSLSLLVDVPAWGQDVPPVVQQHCVRCHGVDGLATQPAMPHLDGQLEQYLVEAMTKFQKGRLPTEVPNHIPNALIASDLETIARHYAANKAQRPAQQVDPDKVARGETVFRSRCADCHMDNGREADKDAPLMAAQNLDYMIKQIKLFVSGKRKFGFLQDDAFKGLSIDELETVAHFLASQEQIAPEVPKAGGKKKQRR
jgi:cytochrome c553